MFVSPFARFAATPVVTAVAILSLALGIGANTAIFSLVNSLILRALPVTNPQRLVILSGRRNGDRRPPFNYRTFDQIRRHREAFDGALAYGNCCSKGTLTICRRADHDRRPLRQRRFLQHAGRRSSGRPAVHAGR